MNLPYELEYFPFPKKEKKVPNVFSYSEVFKIIKNASNLKHKTILMVIYSSGLRVSEVIKLTTDDIIRSNKRLRIRQSKGHKDRYTILSDVAVRCLEKYWKAYRPYRWLFTGKKVENHISVRACQHAYYKAKQKAGITKDGGIHTLRHSFATHSLEVGMGIFQLQKFLGHRCLKTTLQYVHLQEENIIARSPLDYYAQRFKTNSK
jgi:site-specific recombinase XerD